MPTRESGESDPREDEEEHFPLLTNQPTLPNPAPYVARTRRWALVAVVVASFVLAAWVASPLWVAVLLGVVGAVSVQRMYALTLRLVGERHTNWAAAVVTLASGVLVAIVSSLVVFTMTSELMKIVGHLEQQRGRSLAGIVGVRGANVIAGMGIDTDAVYNWLRGQLDAATSYIATLAAVALRTTSFAVLGLVVALVTMYYVLVDGPRLARRIERIAPLEPRHTRALLVEAREVGRTAFLGALVTAVIQGVLAGAGYTILGVPEPVTWAVLTAFASFLPIIGTTLVWGPVAGYLVIDGHPARAVLLLVWGFLVVTSLVDYVIRPRIVGSRGTGHPLLTLLALLGGIEVLGLVGLVVAPIVMSVFVAAIRLYERELRAGQVPGAEPSKTAS